ncbi:MAG: addiction module toxin, RelE/StbE family [Bacteroidales bacterium]
MYYPKRTGQFKKDYKLCMKRNYDMGLIDTAIRILCETGTLPADLYFTHPLKGTLSKYMEAHIEPDWLIEWYIDDDSESEKPGFEGTVHLIRTGTHSDLFR